MSDDKSKARPRDHRVPLLILIVARHATLAWAEDAFGTWKVNPMHSTDAYPKSIVVRFEPHIKEEVFTLDRIDGHGRSTTSSSILYLDSKTRDFQGFGCLGTQSSRRLDSQTVEILRTCASGEWTRFVRRFSLQPKELILEISEQSAAGGHAVPDHGGNGGPTSARARCKVVAKGMSLTACRPRRVSLTSQVVRF